MVEQPGAAQRRIGLALSGGGVRAAAFHLGVLEKLHEFGILDNLDIVSSVSGGSIIAAKYALDGTRDFPKFFDEMKSALGKSLELRTISHWTFLAAVVLPFYSRTDALAATYDRLYYHKRTLGDLPARPEFVINATNVNTGKNWKFRREDMGDYVTGMSKKASSFPVSRAVAASSAAPPLLYPVRLRAHKYFAKPRYPVTTISLSDGGLYDNQGTFALLPSGAKAAKCTHIICSDAAFPFDKQKKCVWSFLPIAALRNVDILMSQIRNLQYRNLLYGQYAESIKTAFFAINWTLPEILLSIKRNTPSGADPQLLGMLDTIPKDLLESLDQTDCEAELIRIREQLAKDLNIPELANTLTKREIAKVAAIGTRLRSLSNEERTRLCQHGASLCAMQVRAYCNDLL
jgi:NTE family protein